MTTPPPRAQRDFIYHLGTVVEQLKSVHLYLHPAQTFEDFKDIWEKSVMARADADAEARHYHAVGRLKIADLVVLGCAYAAQAGTEHHAGRRDIAWTYLTEGQYYAGAALYAKALEEAWPDIESATAQAAVADTKSAGGIARNAAWKRVEDEAVRLVKQLAETEGPWSTERKMAVSIRPALWPFVQREVPDAKASRYVQTISDRLKQRGDDIGMYLKKKA
jgi:hypothetical protein